MTAENPPADYTIQITVGSLSYTIDSADSYDGTDPEQVLDGLTIGWGFPSGKPWPSQPDPVYCTLRLLALDVATLSAEATEGTPVSVQCWDQSGGPGGNLYASFYGRVASASAAPVRRPSGPRTLFTLSCVDYTVDAAETVISVEARPEEDGRDRLTAISSALAALTGFPLTGLPNSGMSFFNASDAVTGDLASLVEEYLRQDNQPSGVGGPSKFTRQYLAPLASALPDVSYTIGRYSTLLDSVELPGLLAVDGGILYLTFPDTIGGDATHGIVDGCRVPFESIAWRNAKRRSVTRVYVTGTGNQFNPAWKVEAKSDSPRIVKLELTSTLTGLDIPASDPLDSDPGNMALMYLPEQSEADSWEAIGFTFNASGKEQQIREWFPDHAQDPDNSYWPIRPVAVTEFPPEINLGGVSSLYTGQLERAELSIARRRVTVSFSLRRTLPIPKANQTKTASFDYVEATFPTIDFDHVDPTLTFYDARLARKA